MAAEPVLTLFGECPACGYPVDDGEPCGQCTAMISDGWLRRVPEPEPMTVEEATVALEAQRLQAEAERSADAAARRHAAEQGQQPMPGQVCWCCEERRTCTRDPDFPREVKWICKDCEAIQ